MEQLGGWPSYCDDPYPCFRCCSSIIPPTGPAMYSRVAAAPPPPPVPYTTRPGRQVRSRLVTSSPPAIVPSGPSCATSSNARERHMTMRFDAGKWTQLPITPEAIRIRINQTLSNLRKVSDKTLYIWEARFKLEIGCIYLTLVEHTAAQVWDRCHKS